MEQIIKNNKWLKIIDDKIWDNNAEISFNRLNLYLNMGREIVNDMLKKDNSNIGGKLLELNMEEYLSSQPWKIENVAHKQHNADFQITTDKNMYLLECKNYKTTVPYTQVDKFFDDLYLRGIDSGILFSNSRVVHCDKVDIIQKNEKKIYVLSCVELNTIEIIINMLDKDNNNGDNINNPSSSLIENFKEHLESLMKMRIKLEKEEIKLRKKINEYEIK